MLVHYQVELITLGLGSPVLGGFAMMLNLERTLQQNVILEYP
jgi:hypothetical protein